MKISDLVKVVRPFAYVGLGVLGTSIATVYPAVYQAVCYGRF